MFKAAHAILKLDLPSGLYARGVVHENLFLDFYGPKYDAYQGIWSPGYFLLVNSYEKILRRFSEPQEASERDQFNLFVSERELAKAFAEIKRQLENKVLNQCSELRQSQDDLAKMKIQIANLEIA